MVRPTLTVIADAMHLEDEEKDSLACSTLEFLKQKYGDNAARIAGLSSHQLKHDAILFLEKHGSEIFGQTRELQLRWPQDEARLVEHLTEWMGVQGDYQRKRARGTEQEAEERLTQGTGSPQTVDDLDDPDYEQPDVDRADPFLHLHYTRGTAPKRPIREAALVPSIEPMSTTKKKRKRNKDEVQVTPVQDTVRRISFDRVVVPDRPASSRMANKEHESSMGCIQDTVIGQDTPIDLSFRNEPGANFSLDDPLQSQSCAYDQNVLSYCQLTPPSSLSFGSHNLERGWTNSHGQDGKPSIAPSMTPMIDMTAQVTIYLGEGRERTLSKEKVPKVFQKFMDLLYDRSDESEQGRRLIRDAQSYERAERGQKAHHISEILSEFWADPLWDED